MPQRKKQVKALCGTDGVWDPASKERFTEITSGRTRWQQGLSSCSCSTMDAKLRKPWAAIRTYSGDVGKAPLEFCRQATSSGGRYGGNLHLLYCKYYCLSVTYIYLTVDGSATNQDTLKPA
jgi:hypothetical protein